MLSVRPEQIQILRNASMLRFEDDAAARLALRSRELGLERTGAELLEFVRAELPRATRFGIQRADDLHCYLEFVLRAGSDFETDAAYDWALEILQHPVLPGSEKIARIDHYETMVLGALDLASESPARVEP